MKRFSLFILVFLGFVVNAADFSSYGSEHLKLKNKYIVEIGTAQEISPPSGQKWKKQLYSLNDSCFTFSPFGYLGLWGLGQSAMLVTDKNRNIQIALLNISINRLEFKLHDVNLVQCPENVLIMPTAPNCSNLKPEECEKEFEEYQLKIKNYQLLLQKQMQDIVDGMKR